MNNQPGPNAPHAGFDNNIDANGSGVLPIASANTIAALKAAITGAPDETPTTIALTTNITFTVASNYITIPANKIITLTSNMEAQDAPFAIDAAELNRVISILANGELTLENITVTGGKTTGSTTTSDGGGIRNLGTLTLDGGTTVSGNTSNTSGGGIQNLGGGTIIMNAGAVISGNTVNANQGLRKPKKRDKQRNI